MAESYQKALKYYNKGSWSRCARTCERILLKESTHIDTLMLYATVSTMMGHAQNAIFSLIKVIELDPDMALAHKQLGVLHSQTGSLEDAEKCLREAISINSNDAESFYYLAVHLKSTGRTQEAEGHYRQALNIAPQDPSIWCGLADAQISLGRLDEALESFQTALKIAPQYLPAINNIAALYIEMEQFALATNYFQQSIDIDPSQPNPWNNIGLAFLRNGDLTNAVSALKKVCDLEPASSPNWRTLGRAYLKQGDYNSAISTFQKARSVNPSDPLAVFLLSAGHIQAGKIEEAVLICDDYLKDHPSDSVMLACKALIVSEHGPLEELNKFHNFTKLLYTITVAAPPEFKNQEFFNQALSDHILNHPTLVYAPAKHATRNGHHTGNLLENEKGPIRFLEDSVLASVDKYIDFLSQDPSNDFLIRNKPNRWHIIMWGVAMKNQGHQIAHMHPGAWASGVYYAKLPSVVAQIDAEKEGWIEFGSPTEEFISVKQGVVEAFQPKEGIMFMFPGYLTHRTIPFSSEELRISIAFNIQPD